MPHGDHTPDLGIPNGIAQLDAGGVHPVAQLRVFTPATPSTAGAAGVLPAPAAGQGTLDYVPSGDGFWRKSQETLPAAIQAVAQERPGTFFAGQTVYLYPASASVVAQQIQYTRIFLVSGALIEFGEAYIAQGSNGREVRVGLYDQADPSDANDVPRNKLAETPLISTTGLSETFVRAAFSGGVYNVPTTGYYWVAFVGEASQIKIAATAAVYRANYLPVRRETTTATSLPATAGGLTNPAGAVGYAGVIEAGF